ncbi:MAG TPA: SDR family NAD(P)-dependent oxidoreductase [Tessaracoccus flavescens]|uniref:SDR family NAD(P)-dependent oxidoreductase n=1 Tax=Tessaracoccus flavescens TaxID=399497 RepID=A0A921ER28_9ACTN|nr:SDR family NAD(P)-dependent oxidoreductase [Tessaracoccus flavescens]
MKTAVVTGASSGIGAATARHLAAQGYRVIVAARRTDRLEPLAAEIDGEAVACDVTNPDDVAALAAAVGDRLDVLVNNAGGAIGLEPVADADFDAWEQMYATNTLGTARVTKALLPALIAAEGVIVFVTSTAAEGGYEGGAGYCAAKSGERAVVEALRLELFDQPVRVTEISPGMVHTDEFSLTRFHGDQAKADAVYRGVEQPLTADDVAEAITWMATRPAHVNVDRLILRPRAQASNYKVHRTS